MSQKIEILQYDKKTKWICYSLKIFSRYVCYCIIHTIVVLILTMKPHLKQNEKQKEKHNMELLMLLLLLFLVEDVCFANHFVFWVFFDTFHVFPCLFLLSIGLGQATSFCNILARKCLFCPFRCLLVYDVNMYKEVELKSDQLYTNCFNSELN